MKKFSFRAILFCLVLGTAFPAYALELGMPLRCDYGHDCFIQNYFDEDSARGPDAYKDYTCGHLSYDGHDGTDFRIRDYVAMEKGVEVVAAAAGKVAAAREGMADINVRKIGKETVMDQGCGNAVVLLHEDGYRTMYCHMKKGSIAVTKGEVVAKGQKLGEIGLSGLTEFPHVHLGVFKDRKAVDPFTGGRAMDGCAPPDTPLWDTETKQTLSYIPTGLLNSSFSNATPSQETTEQGQFRLDTLPRNADALMLWVELFGLQPGDVLTLTILSPDGRVLLHKSNDLPRHKAMFFEYVGLKKKVPLWPEGNYTGKIQLQRGGKSILEEGRSVMVR